MLKNAPMFKRFDPKNKKQAGAGNIHRIECKDPYRVFIFSNDCSFYSSVSLCFQVWVLVVVWLVWIEGVVEVDVAAAVVVVVLVEPLLHPKRLIMIDFRRCSPICLFCLLLFPALSRLAQSASAFLPSQTVTPFLCHSRLVSHFINPEMASSLAISSSSSAQISIWCSFLFVELA
jgi:hypothetical protein